MGLAPTPTVATTALLAVSITETGAGVGIRHVGEELGRRRRANCARSGRPGNGCIEAGRVVVEVAVRIDAEGDDIAGVQESFARWKSSRPPTLSGCCAGGPRSSPL